MISRLTLARAPRLSAAFSTAPSGLPEVVIVSASRTAVGSFGGSLSSLSAPALGAAAIAGALARLPPEAAVGEVIFGNVVSANVGQAPARQAARAAAAAGARQLSDAAACTTVNKVCASGLKAAALAAQSVALGQHEVVVAGGMESMSNAPFVLPAQPSRFGGLRFGHSKLVDSLVADGLWDPYNDMNMGFIAEACAKELGISRAEQDAYAAASYRRAQAARAGGVFGREIVPVSVGGGRGGAPPRAVTEDEEVGKVDFAKMASLRPAFPPPGGDTRAGTVTAANSSKLSDGAAALVLMSAARAAALGLRPMARVVAAADAEQPPTQYPTAPAAAVRRALARARMELRDVDLHEVNEAFAVVALANARLLELDPERLNVHGGAVSLGHPLGASGARILISLMSALREKDRRVGVASICNGGGGASAMVIERLE